MPSKIKIILIIVIGFILGVAVTLTSGQYLVRQYFKKVHEIAARVSNVSDFGDPKHQLSEARAELKKAQDEYHIWLALTDVCFWEVDAGLNKDSRNHADQVLSLSKKYKNDWNSGNAIHKGNLALGRLALREGNIERANYYLLEAGKTPGSPQLDSFGPNMLLAKELLEHGEKKSVLEYFELCGRFWELDRGKLKEWAALVKDGITPDFGANILY